MAGQGVELLAGGWVPDNEGSIAAGRDQEAPVAAYCAGRDSATVTLERAEQRTGFTESRAGPEPGALAAGAPASPLGFQDGRRRALPLETVMELLPEEVGWDR